MDKKSYNLSADVIRVVAITGVVVIHTANSVFARPDFFGGISWWFAIILNSVSRVSIPLFIMVSGYFILAKTDTFKKLFGRAYTRLFVPLFFWFIFYAVWNSGNPTLEYINFSILYRLFTVNVFFLYFFIILIGLYLASPLIKELLHKVSKDKLTILLLAGGCIYYLFQYFFYLCTPAYSLIYWVPFSGLFLAGYTIGNKKLTNFNLPIVTIIASIAVTIIGAYLYYSFTFNGNNIMSDRGCLSFYTDSFLSINVVIMSVSIFAILMSIDFKKFLGEKLQRFTYSIARASLGIYVLHIFLIDVLEYKVHLFSWITPLWLYLIVKLIVIFLLSYLLTLVIMRIPVLRKTIGEK